MSTPESPEHIPQGPSEGIEVASPRRTSEKLEQREVSPERVLGYLSSVHGEVNLELERLGKGLPREERASIAPDFRICPPAAAYSEKEKKEVEDALQRQFGSAEESHVRAKETESGGTKFELLKTAVMHRNLKSRFLVLRSSRYDDIKNGVDNVIIDKITGETICALDEISAGKVFSADERLAEKRKKVLGMNFGIDVANEAKSGIRQTLSGEQGARLKYGLELSGGALRSKEVKHLPIFLLALDSRRLTEGLESFDPDPASSGSEYEKRLFDFFLGSIALQIQELKLDVHGYDKLPPDLRDRIENFERFIEESKK